MNSLHRHTISFKNAFSGFVYMVRTQPNFRIHLIAAIAVSLLSYYLKVSRSDFLIILFTILLVLMAEMLNTAVESVVDLVTDKYHLLAKVSKDVAAGMVLVTAFFSVIIGILILWPYF